jgi:thioredoxin-like negative regulator of GroEL
MGVLVNFKIELTAADIELIGQLLDDQPYKLVAPLARRVQAQIDAQNAAANTPDIMEVATATAVKPKRKGR